MLSQEEYERISEEDMETLSENLGALCEEVGNEKWEVDYSVRRQAGLVDELKAETRLVWCSHPIDTATRHIRAEQTTAKSANMDLVPGVRSKPIRLHRCGCGRRGRRAARRVDTFQAAGSDARGHGGGRAESVGSREERRRGVVGSGYKVADWRRMISLLSWCLMRQYEEVWVNMRRYGSNSTATDAVERDEVVEVA
jgi:hypothetical protein